MRKNKNVVTRFFSFLLVLAMAVGMFPATSAFAAEVNPSEANYMDSCWGITSARVTVYDEYKNAIGALAANEGFTVIGSDLIGAGETAYMVNYSTSSGAKTGYIILGGSYVLASSTTCAGIVNTNTTVYYGKNTNQYQTVGSVSAGEYVSVLAESSGKVYIEYNTNSGRKRGWCASSAITKKMSVLVSCTLGALPCNATWVNTNRTYSSRNVYAGPSTVYYQVGAIGTSSSTESVYITAEYTYNGQTWAYITYSVPGQKDKSGYIRIQ